MIKKDLNLLEDHYYPVIVKLKNSDTVDKVKKINFFSEMIGKDWSPETL